MNAWKLVAAVLLALLLNVHYIATTQIGNSTHTLTIPGSITGIILCVLLALHYLFDLLRMLRRAGGGRGVLRLTPGPRLQYAPMACFLPLLLGYSLNSNTTPIEGGQRVVSFGIGDPYSVIFLLCICGCLIIRQLRRWAEGNLVFSAVA